jgi:hypothetical protein
VRLALYVPVAKLGIRVALHWTGTSTASIFDEPVFTCSPHHHKDTIKRPGTVSHAHAGHFNRHPNPATQISKHAPTQKSQQQHNSQRDAPHTSITQPATHQRPLPSTLSLAPQSHRPSATPHLRPPSPLTSCQPHSSVPLALTLRTTSRSSTRAASLPNTLGIPRLGSHERVMGRRGGLERVYRCILRLQPYHQSRPVHTTRRDYYYHTTTPLPHIVIQTR